MAPENWRACSWVDGRSPWDPFVAVSAGRSPFRTADQLELAELFGELDLNDRYAHHAGHLEFIKGPEMLRGV